MNEYYDDIMNDIMNDIMMIKLINFNTVHTYHLLQHS